MEQRLERIARNEALFRAVNERIEELSAKFEVLPESGVEFHCECGRDGCDARISMTLGEYDIVRRETDRFAVVPGHETPELEYVVHDGARYRIVDKLAPAEPFVGADGIPRSGL